MRILVTGTAGKVGRYTARELADSGHEVVHVDRVRPAEPVPGPFLLADLADYGQTVDAFAQFRPEAVCHIAANPAPGGHPRHQVFANNTLSAYHVLEAAGDFGCCRVIYASSEMATGWLTTDQLPPRLPFAEEDRVASPNAYALSKYLSEVIADALAARYPQTAYCGLRLNNVIVPPEGYAAMARQRARFPEGAGNFWSYLDVRDAARAFRAAVEGESRGNEVFLVAAADTRLELPIQEALARVHGSRAPACAPGHGPHQSLFDCGKMARFFGWRAQYSWRDAVV